MKRKAKFSLGVIVLTNGAIAAFERAREGPIRHILRHVVGDWGTVCAEDRQANEQALRYGGRILSAYHLSDGTKLWIITEADRSATTLLLPQSIDQDPARHSPCRAFCLRFAFKGDSLLWPC